jgi:MoaA/NifB/PqqE/SkfB family radical SAM enzyme
VIDLTGMLRGVEPRTETARRGSLRPDDDSERRPVVVWDVTRSCNLACIHCFADSAAQAYPGELTTAQGRELLEDLAQFGVREVVLSGGEPLVRRDTLALVEYSRALGLTFALSTNGTLLDLDTAQPQRRSDREGRGNHARLNTVAGNVRHSCAS